MEISRTAQSLCPITQWFILLGLVLGVTVTNSFARFTYGLMLPAMQTEMN